MIREDKLSPPETRAHRAQAGSITMARDPVRLCRRTQRNRIDADSGLNDGTSSVEKVDKGGQTMTRSRRLTFQDNELAGAAILPNGLPKELVIPFYDQGIDYRKR